MTVRVPALVLVAALGCDAPPPSSAVPAAAAPAAPEPTASRYLESLTSRTWPEAPAPAEPVRVRFDFSGRRVYAYDFHQQAAVRMGGFAAPGRPELDREQEMSGDGVLLLKGKGDGTGTLVIRELKTKVDFGGDQPGEMTAPPMAVPDVKEDGGMEGGALAAQPMLRLLFPLPLQPLSKGEAVEVPLAMPFHAMGSALMVRGTSRITLTGFVERHGRLCARLEAEIDLSKLDVPPEAELKASCALRGRSVYYWDVEARDFASGATAVLTTMRSERPTPRMRRPEGAPPPPDTTTLRLASDHLLRITRNAGLAAKEEAAK